MERRQAVPEVSTSRHLLGGWRTVWLFLKSRFTPPALFELRRVYPPKSRFSGTKAGRRDLYLIKKWLAKREPFFVLTLKNNFGILFHNLERERDG
ncbi:MAG: hypothetical protein WBW16_08700 [Bacteroidota bacterium]